MPNVWLTSDPDYARKASGPDDGDGLMPVAGDFREFQGSLWPHDHRFFFTAENVHKGMFATCNFYSGPDRGSDRADRSNINLRVRTQDGLSLVFYDDVLKEKSSIISF